MDEFCGDVKHAWGPTAKGYLTHCFDDLVLYGVTVCIPPPCGTQAEEIFLSAEEGSGAMSIFWCYLGITPKHIYYPKT